MRILYIHQYFKTPETGGGLRSYYLTRYLAKTGYDIEVITSHNASSYKHQTVEGVSVHYLPVQYENSFGIARRIYAFIKFIFLSLVWSVRIRNIDLCYVMTTPLTTGFIGLFNKWFLSRSFIFEVGDLWPAVPISMGVIRNPIIIKLTKFLEKLFYRNAKGLVGLSPDISSHLALIAPDTPMCTIPNIADCEYFRPSTKTAYLQQTYGIDSSFVVSYIGALGKANQLIQLLDAAASVKELPVHFCIVGAGAEREMLIEYAERKLLTNVTFIQHQNRDGVKYILNDSDVIYMSFLPVPIISSGSPNKFFDGLASGKAIVSNFEGWTKNLIQEHDLGFVYNPKNLKDFESQLRQLMDDTTGYAQISERSRQLAEDQFSVEVLGKQLDRFIMDVCPNPRP